jgi:hypothetical protein
MRTVLIIVVTAGLISSTYGEQQGVKDGPNLCCQSSSQATTKTSHGSGPRHCALFGLWPVSGGIEHYCDFYENDCGEIPTASFAVFDNYYDSYSCPDLHCDGIAWTDGKTRVTASPPHAPLLNKVPRDRLPVWVSRNIRELRAYPISFVPNGASRPVYMRVIEMLHFDEQNINKTRTFVVGMEMEDPKAGDTVPDYTSKVQLLVAPHLYVLKLGEEVVGATSLGQRKIMLIRAKDAT